MFTGIIEATAEVLRHQDGELSIERPPAFHDSTIGSSISVSGVCLTIIDLDDISLSFAVVPETLKRSSIGSLEKGHHVNLERALPATGRFDGHVVQGHVEGVGEVTGEFKNGLLTVILPEELLPFVAAKGSIAIDGVSLTVASLRGRDCSVALIPHTLKETTLGSLHAGDHVNIETDILGRTLRSPTP